MGVSFKVAKVGTRFRQKITQTEETDDGVKEKPSTIEGDFVGANVADFSDSLAHTGSSPLPEDLEVSFTLNLFPDGFSIGKAIELDTNGVTCSKGNSLATVPRSTKAIASLWLGIQEAILCKYIHFS
ncbi:hypothetical protein GIB67_022457 [Kingdonia uniflora]|uniref:Uncharacterized protein n=1 Tax=Kingdonia uniflora TaxID=39325 RepID=A0A7J7MU81_9MAGN|nr:hypothetical protein GIB67_022457 [Kingdonia uniflora]